MNFFETKACGSKVHCVACRTDAAWRESLHRAGLVDSAEFGCPYGITAETAPAIQAEAIAKLAGGKEQAEAAAKRKAEMEEQGRAAWRWLHKNAQDDSLTPDRLKKEFEPMIPAFGCSCKREWQEILQKNPLPEKGQFEWSWIMHQDVNKKLGKAGITLNEAVNLWAAK